jgi:hypothetical protein
MRKKQPNWLVASGIASVVLAGLLAANLRSIPLLASPAPDLFALVPSGAPTVAFLDLAAIRETSIYKNRKDRSPIALPSGDYANFVAETGFDFEHDLDRVVLAAWPKLAPDDMPKAVVVAEGRFDRAKIRAYATKHGKITQQLNHEVFVFPAQGAAASANQGSSMVFLDEHHLGMVGGADISVLLNAHGAGATDPVQERVARVQAASAFIILHASAFPVGATMKGTPAGQFAGLAQTIDWLSLAVTPEGENARLSLEGECKTPADAHQLHSALELVRQLGLAGVSDPKAGQQMDPAQFAALKSLVTNLEIKETDNYVRILMQITPEMMNLLNAQRGNAGARTGK